MAKYMCYRSNILLEQGVQSVQERVEGDNVVEAAMLYHKKHNQWPEEIYLESTKSKSELYTQIEAVKFRTKHIEEQRDNFAGALAAVERDRDVAYRQIEKLHEIVRVAINDVNARIKKHNER